MTQAILHSLTPDSIPVQAQAPSATDAVFYLPEIWLPGRHKSFFPDLAQSDTTVHTIVADIATNQHDDVRRVIAIDLPNGKSWDASREIARHVLDAVLEDHATVPAWCIDFLEEHLGIGTVAMAERQAA